jgi:hypothetical protein
MNEAIDQLIDIIINVDVLGSCGALCGQLPNALEQTVCNLLCDYVGINAFIDALNYEDPDPIYFCEVVDLCPVNMNAAGKIVKAFVSPATGRSGATFTVEVDFQVINTTGTATLGYTVVPPDGSFPFGEEILMVSQKPGFYAAKFQFQAEPSEVESFAPGVYQTYIGFCEGECGSPHPYTKVLDQKTISFRITN